MTAYLYLLGDADRVREGIDRRLLRGQLDELRQFSSTLTEGLANLVHSLEVTMNAEVIMAGGDDVLVRVLAAEYSLQKHQEIARSFHETTGCHMSFGVATRISSAYLNLRRAKSEQTGICFGDDNL